MRRKLRAQLIVFPGFGEADYSPVWPEPADAETKAAHDAKESPLMLNHYLVSFTFYDRHCMAILSGLNSREAVEELCESSDAFFQYRGELGPMAAYLPWKLSRVLDLEEGAVVPHVYRSPMIEVLATPANMQKKLCDYLGAFELGHDFMLRPRESNEAKLGWLLSGSDHVFPMGMPKSLQLEKPGCAKKHVVGSMCSNLGYASMVLLKTLLTSIDKFTRLLAIPAVVSAFFGGSLVMTGVIYALVALIFLRRLSIFAYRAIKLWVNRSHLHGQDAIKMGKILKFSTDKLKKLEKVTQAFAYLIKCLEKLLVAYYIAEVFIKAFDIDSHVSGETSYNLWVVHSTAIIMGSLDCFNYLRSRKIIPNCDKTVISVPLAILKAMSSSFKYFATMIYGIEFVNTFFYEGARVVNSTIVAANGTKNYDSFFTLSSGNSSVLKQTLCQFPMIQEHVMTNNSAANDAICAGLYIGPLLFIFSWLLVLSSCAKASFPVGCHSGNFFSTMQQRLMGQSRAAYYAVLGFGFLWTIINVLLGALAGASTIVPFVSGTMLDLLFVISIQAGDDFVNTMLYAALPIMAVKTLASWLAASGVMASLTGDHRVSDSSFDKADSLFTEVIENPDTCLKHNSVIVRLRDVHITSRNEVLDLLRGDFVQAVRLPSCDIRLLHAMLNQARVNGSTNANLNFKAVMEDAFPGHQLDAGQLKKLRRDISHMDVAAKRRSTSTSASSLFTVGREHSVNSSATTSRTQSRSMSSLRKSFLV